MEDTAEHILACWDLRQWLTDCSVPGNKIDGWLTKCYVNCTEGKTPSLEPKPLLEPQQWRVMTFHQLPDGSQSIDGELLIEGEVRSPWGRSLCPSVLPQGSTVSHPTGLSQRLLSQLPTHSSVLCFLILGLAGTLQTTLLLC